MDLLADVLKELKPAGTAGSPAAAPAAGGGAPAAGAPSAEGGAGASAGAAPEGGKKPERYSDQFKKKYPPKNAKG